MDVNRFSVEALLFFFSTSVVGQLAKFIYTIYPLAFPVYLAIKLAILLIALLIITRLKRSSEIGEIVILSALTFIALG